MALGAAVTDCQFFIGSTTVVQTEISQLLAELRWNVVKKNSNNISPIIWTSWQCYISYSTIMRFIFGVMSQMFWDKIAIKFVKVTITITNYSH